MTLAAEYGVLPEEAALVRGRQRLWLAAGIFAIAFFMVAIRLVEVSVLTADSRSPSRVAHHNASSDVTFERGEITDRNGVLLATNLTTASVYANPLEIKDIDEAVRGLRSVFPDLAEETLRSRLESRRSFVWINRNITPSEMYDVNALGIPGVYFQRDERRTYPHGRLTAHILGQVDVDNIGVSGIERSFDSLLRDHSNHLESLELSLDIRVQYALYEELKTAMQKFRARGASGVVLDVNSGEILGMVSLPDFDPHDSKYADAAARFNRNTLGVYEMGSTFKSFTVAMALDSGRVSVTDTYDTSEPIRYAGRVIRDYHPRREPQSVPEIYIHSSNIGTVKMAMDAGLEREAPFLSRLGMLDRLEIELPEAAQPMVPAKWREINAMTVSYGHGIAVTPLHLARGTAALINGGQLKPVTLLKEGNGKQPEGERVISSRTSAMMRAMMRLTVQEGTGRKAKVVGYRVGGKTGTAEKAVNGHYKRDALLSSFIGAFPMDDPKYLVLAVMDEPQGIEETHGYATGGYTAAPVVANVVSRIGPMLGIEPEIPTEIDEAPTGN